MTQHPSYPLDDVGDDDDDAFGPASPEPADILDDQHADDLDLEMDDEPEPEPGDFWLDDDDDGHD